VSANAVGWGILSLNFTNVPSSSIVRPTCSVAFAGGGERRPTLERQTPTDRGLDGTFERSFGGERRQNISIDRRRAAKSSSTAAAGGTVTPRTTSNSRGSRLLARAAARRLYILAKRLRFVKVSNETKRKLRSNDVRISFQNGRITKTPLYLLCTANIS